MDKFRTEVIPDAFPWNISYHSTSFFIGSCFTQHIGTNMQALKFNAEVNPFGVVYNPISVRNSLDTLLKKELFSENDLHFRNENWFSFYHHSSFSNPKKEACLENINSKINSASTKLAETNYLAITFGTARVFRRKETEEIVSNCHKLPASVFKREILSVEQIVAEYISLLELMFKTNPDLKVILTVSPIRHWKDGAEGNQISKSILLLAASQLVEKYENVYYFPSYEIMMDDLRDYRFYAEDMIHLSPLAIKYIWEKFSDVVFDQETLKLFPRIQKINKALSHTPFHSSSKLYKDFCRKTLKEIETLEKENSRISFVDEKVILSNYIDNQ